MTNLFKKAVCFTDMHLGLKGNSDTHNEDCVEFTRWMIDLAKKENCESCFFLGDYHNNRASMNIKTMSYAVRILEEVGSAFSQTFFIPGNHDQFFRDKRDIQSAEWAKHIPNVHIVNDFFKESDVSIVPWLVNDEHKRIERMHTKYCFGHFELPHFYMNGLIQMPDHGAIQREHFGNIENVYSGHFHKRQSNKNIHYIGNCFPHNYGDAGDTERGCMILEWGKGHFYHTWPNQPTYQVYNLSHLMVKTDELLKPRTHVRANIDFEISYEEVNEVKNTFVSKYDLRELAIIPAKRNEMTETQVADLSFHTVDQIVNDHITAIESEHYDPKILLEIYNTLSTTSP